MSRHQEYGPLADVAELEELGSVLSQCFGSQARHWTVFFERIGLGNLRVLRKGGGLSAGLGYYRLGQWFGGRSVPMAGVAGVGVAPEHRGEGVGAELMRRTLEELHAEGMALSALYASTQTLYRKVGYEWAGSRTHYSAPVARLGVKDRRLPMRPVDPAMHSLFHSLYRSRAQISNGNLDRNHAIWERTAMPRQDETKHAYLVGEQGDERGYVIFHQTSGTHLHYNLTLVDLVALDAAAARRLWTFFADHRSLADEVRWTGPPSDPFLLSLPEETWRATDLTHWLLRIVDLAQALGRRGYPPEVDAELHLDVSDPMLPANSGRFVLKVGGGQGEVKRGGNGDLRIEIRSLAPLYSGLYSPAVLRMMGELEASDEALAAAARIFAGPAPWMPDMF